MAHSVPVKSSQNSVMGTVTCQAKGVQTNSHRKQERGTLNSEARFQSGAWYVHEWGELMKQGISKVSYITHFLA